MYSSNAPSKTADILVATTFRSVIPFLCVSSTDLWGFKRAHFVDADLAAWYIGSGVDDVLLDLLFSGMVEQ